MHKNFRDLTGKKINMLTVLGLTDDYVQDNGRVRHRYLCQCDCGNIVKITSDHLSARDVQSCGCARKIAAQKQVTHPYVHTRLYSVWSNMLTRCNNPNVAAYKDYGGRGISVCDEWNNAKTFCEWAIANGYSDNLTLDRIDNNKGYSPDNCRWADLTTQANNKRYNRLITYQGETKTAAEWAREIGMKYCVFHNRLRLGWSPERAITQPVRKSNRSNTNVS